MSKVSQFIFALFAIALVSAYASAAQLLQLESFQRIDVQGPVNVRAQSGAAVKVLAEPHHGVSFEVADGVLYIDAGEAASDQGAIEVEITVPELKEVFVADGASFEGFGLVGDELAVAGTGESELILENLEVDALYAEGDGQVRFDVSGSAQRQVVNLNGANTYNAIGLNSDTSEIRVRGLGEIEISCDTLLDLVVLGHGLVRYAGTPRIVKRVLGAADLNQI